MFSFGVWLSLVERCVRDAEVACSNPVTPTKKQSTAKAVLCFLLCCAFEQRVPQVPNRDAGQNLSGKGFAAITAVTETHTRDTSTP